MHNALEGNPQVVAAVTEAMQRFAAVARELDELRAGCTSERVLDDACAAYASAPCLETRRGLLAALARGADPIGAAMASLLLPRLPAIENSLLAKAGAELEHAAGLVRDAFKAAADAAAAERRAKSGTGQMSAGEAIACGRRIEELHRFAEWAEEAVAAARRREFAKARHLFCSAIGAQA